jgi:myo-inositol-1-phosphate synthase
VNLSKILKEENLLSSLQEIVAISGWDTHPDSIYNACVENKIIPTSLLESLKEKYPLDIHRPIELGIVYPSFIGLPVAIQTSGSFAQDIRKVTKDIDQFTMENKLDLVIVLYSGSTERKPPCVCAWNCSNLFPTPTNPDFLEESLLGYQLSPSQVYALGTALAQGKTSFVNCAAQDTLCSSIQKVFKKRGRLAIGNDLQTGQTRLKSGLLGCLLGHGIPCTQSINLNYLGNRDGFNLANVETNLSKTTSKSSMMSGIQQQAPTLYQDTNRHMDSLVNIIYMPSVGDNKRGLDEYCFELPFQSSMQMFIQCTYADTALAMGVMTDLIIALSTLVRLIYVPSGQPDGDKIGFPLSLNQANAILACLVKNPQTNLGRFTLHENQDVLTGLFLEVCGIAPETRRHDSIFTKTAKPFTPLHGHQD